MTKTFLTPILLSLLSLAAFTAVAASPDSGSNSVVVLPSEIVRRAIDHNPALKVRDEDTRAATARLRQAEAAGRFAADVRFQALHFEGLENETLGPGISLPVIEDQYAGSVGLTQPLYTGGRVAFQKRSARLSESAARLSQSAATADLILKALTAYWQWSKAVYQVESLESATTRVQAQTADTRHLHEAGMATDNDLLAAEVLLDQTRLQLDDCVRKTDVARIQLERLTGMPLPASGRPQPPACPLAPNLSLDAVQALALTNRTELAALSRQAAAAEASVRAVHADKSPQISLVARYEQGRPNMRDFPPDDKWADDTYVGAVASWNIFDGGMTRGRVAEAQARAVQARLQLQDAQEGIRAQAEEAFLSLRHAISRVQTAAHAESSASRNVQSATDLWKGGLARHSDVLDAQSRLTDAVYQRIGSEADAVVAEATLRYATGFLKSSDSHDNL